MTDLKCTIDGEEVIFTEIDSETYYDCSNGNVYHIFKNRKEAEEEARGFFGVHEYDIEDFKHLILLDPKFFIDMLDPALLEAWWSDKYYAGGIVTGKSFESWFDIWLDTPERQWGAFDGTTKIEDLNDAMMEKFGKDVVVYRES